jgi:hypothetical protein
MNPKTPLEQLQELLKEQERIIYRAMLICDEAIEKDKRIRNGDL